MRIEKFPRSIGSMILNCVLFIAGNAQTLAKKVVATEADLPRFSYPVTGDVQQVLNLSPDDFAKFPRPILSDIESTLRDYDQAGVDTAGGHFAHPQRLRYQRRWPSPSDESPKVRRTTRGPEKHADLSPGELK